MNKSTKPLKDHLTDFLEYCEVEKGLASRSQENYNMFLRKFLEFLANKHLLKLLPHELNNNHIWSYKLFLARAHSPHTGEPLKRSTQRYYLIALRSLLNYFTDRDILSIPAEKIKLGKDMNLDSKVKFLTLEQIERLLTAPDPKTLSGVRDRAIMEALFSTGLRVAELVSLNINQLNPKAKEMELSIIGKGKKVRVVYLSARAMNALREYLSRRTDSHPPLFVNVRPNADIADDKRLTIRSVERIIKQYVKLTGLPIYTSPHTLRHSYATDLLSQGADLRAIQEFLGHSSITTTQVYTHVTNKRLKDIHRKYHSGHKLK